MALFCASKTARSSTPSSIRNSTHCSSLSCGRSVWSRSNSARMSAGTKAATIEGVGTAAIVTALRARLETQLAAPASRYRPLVVDDVCVGWLDDIRAARLVAHPDVFFVAAHQVGLASALTHS